MTDVMPFEDGDDYLESFSNTRRRTFQEAFLAFLGPKSKNTRRSYRTALRQFFRFVDGKLPDDVTVFDVAAFQQHLKHEDLSDNTIRQRLAALSSFYKFLNKPRGASEDPLVMYNPVEAVERPQAQPYGKAKNISMDEFVQILQQIDRDTVKGKRDWAMFFFYFINARRRSEVTQLTWGDLRFNPERGPQYRVVVKGGKQEWRDLTPPVWEAMQDYLDASGRELDDDSPMFVATTDKGKYLPHYEYEDHKQQALSGASIYKALKHYAEKAGVNPDRVTLHSLRHLGAMYYHNAHGDLAKTQRFLGHARSDNTSLYLQQLTGERHDHWQSMVNAMREHFDEENDAG